MPSVTTTINLPIGTTVWSQLTESQFQDEAGTGWILSDGRSVVGSLFEARTGQSNVPDQRSTYPRCKDNGRGLDPNGDTALGTYYADEFVSHAHSASTSGATRKDTGGAGGFSAKFSTNSGQNFDCQWSGGTTVFANGGNETRPKTTIHNAFIRIN